MAQPSHRVKLTRKDKQEITFTDYKGEKVTKKAAPFGSIFTNENGSMSLVLEKGSDLAKKLEGYYINIYPNDGGPPGGGSRDKSADDNSTGDGELDF